MKYLVTILCIVIAITLASIFVTWPENKPAEKDVVLSVNDYKATNSMLEKSENQRSSYHESRSEFLNSMAIEQVLIQEAKRQEIDQEPVFREAIKDYYEQSLVKILLDRHNKTIDNTVTDEEIDTYLGYFGRTITFTIARGAGTITPEVDWSSGQSSTELFDNLSTTLQPVLAGLEPGTTRAVFDTGNEWYAVRIESISGAPAPEAATIPRDTIRTIIASHKREQQLNNWINTLIANADISIKGEEK